MANAEAATSGTQAPLPESARPGAARRLLRDLLGSPKGLTGLAMVALVILSAALATSIAPNDPAQQVIAHRFLPPAWAEGGNWSHPLGGDNLGRDILSRTLVGAQVSVQVALIVTAVIVLVGTLVGLLAGYYGRWVDSLLMRLVDFQMSFPFILLALLLLAILGKGFWTLVLALSVAFWVNIARLVRSETMRIRELEFVQAARGMGIAEWRILVGHILPNTMPALVVLATLDVAVIVLAEAAMSFLGLGIQPPTPSWGTTISDGRNYLYEAPWMTLAPGVMIMLTAIGINLFGDFLRDTYDPRLASR